jgi:UDP-N-acetylglucosamine--N-acetylmuramyl-(pentapeptide) pyrophosphoryl-undecaprenol N-acetylglucosamine transferase
VPGFAHRRIGPLAARVLLGFESAGRYFPEGRWEVSGVPIREEFFRVPAKPHQPPFTVLITGGSQGSRRLNAAAIESLPLWAAAGRLDRTIFVHQTGTKDYNHVSAEYERTGARAEVTPFLEDMPGAFARADVVVCRAGASAVAELAAAGKAAILAPFPLAADRHQLRNAEAMAAAGAARVVEDRDLDGKRLYAELETMLDEPARLERMEQAARRLARPGAAQRAAEVLEQVARHVL